MTIERIKYTPGPWAVDDSFSHVGMPAVRAAGYEIVAEPNEALAECTANARLIAAAPELLEGLQLLLDACERANFTERDWVDYENDSERRWGWFMAKARTAITHATGEQP